MQTRLHESPTQETPAHPEFAGLPEKQLPPEELPDELDEEELLPPEELPDELDEDELLEELPVAVLPELPVGIQALLCTSISFRPTA